MSRRTARETAMQAYYQMEIRKEYETGAVSKYIDGATENENDKSFTREMVNIFIANKEEIDEEIVKNLKGWSIDRLSLIDLSILRIGVAEMLYREDIPAKVSINEAIELGKRYGTDDSPSFISGLLGAVVGKEGLDE